MANDLQSLSQSEISIQLCYCKHHDSVSTCDIQSSNKQGGKYDCILQRNNGVLTPTISAIFFNVHGTVHHYVCILYNQRDAIYTVFFIIISAVRVSGGFSAHHQETIKLCVQPWVLSCLSAVYHWCGWVGTVPSNSSNPSKPAADSRKA